MNYTEEEFFGNKQNEENQQYENQDAKVDVGSTILATFLKTFGVLVCAAFYFLAVAVSMMPKTAIKIYGFLGVKNAEIACYERIYEKSGNLADLYNLVQKSIEAKDYEKTTKYIKELQGKNGYNEFCAEVNTAIIEASESKYIAYVGDLDGYLVSQNILALYTNGKINEAKDVAINDLVYNENVYSFGLSAYVDCLMGDNSLSEEERKLKLETLCVTTYDNGESIKAIIDYIEDKRTLADEINAEAENKADAILRVYTCLKIDNVLLQYYEATNDESNANARRSQIEELQERYNVLIG